MSPAKLKVLDAWTVLARVSVGARLEGVSDVPRLPIVEPPSAGETEEAWASRMLSLFDDSTKTLKSRMEIRVVANELLRGARRTW